LAISKAWKEGENIEGFDAILEEDDEEEEREHMLKLVLRFGFIGIAWWIFWFFVVSKRGGEEESEHRGFRCDFGRRRRERAHDIAR
jgi:MoaA/NifB/PqqE/SkfB family radical SAM enzyme